MQERSIDNSIVSLKAQKDAMEAAEGDGEQDFDKEAYRRLKEELTQRRQAKERLLSQGLPQFSAYLRL